MQTLFSEHWHLVSHVRPRLREAVDVFPRRLRGRSWIFLHDQATQKFLRVTPEAWLVIKLMDGKSTLEQIWEVSCLAQQNLQHDHQSSHDDLQIISQHDLVNLLSQLYSNDMLQTQLSADAEEMTKRFRKQKFQQFKQSYLNPISIKIPLWYPDRWFTRQTPIALRIYTWTFLCLWLIITLPALFLASSHWQALTANLSDRILSTSNLFILWCTYPIVKAIHEWAHGLAVKAWGGVVREIGLMLIIFMPVPYVDATYSYRFTSKWVRALVAATGVMAELFLGAIALYVWLNVESGLLRAFAFNVIFIAGVSSLLVNGNPLMRYDGYYVLTDLIEIPNLSQRAKNYWIYLSDRYFFGATDAKPPVGYDNEKGWLLVYGFIAPIYRIVIIFALIWFVAQKYFVIGILMAIVSFFMSFIVPAYKGIKHIYTGNSLMKRRLYAKRRFHYTVVGILVVLFALPFPFYSIQQGVVWLPEGNIVRARIDGTIEEIVTVNAKVAAQQPLVRLVNQDIEQQYRNTNQRLAELESKIRQAQATDMNKYHELNVQYQTLLKQRALIHQELTSTEVKAPNQGIWYPATVDTLSGRYLKRGEIIGYVVPKQTNIVKVVIEQNVMHLIDERLQGISVKSVTDLTRSYNAQITRKTPQAGFDLPSAALGSNAGGQILVDPSGNEGTKSVQRVFDVDLVIDNNQLLKETQPLGFNDKVYVRFDLGYLPIGWQWLIQFRQILLNKFDV